MTCKSGVILAILVLTLGACQQNPPMHISRTDKTIGGVYITKSLMYFGYPYVDWEAAQSMALNQCQEWGYSKAEHRGDTNKCMSAGHGCDENIFTRTYQCVE
jgi:hypothetical protein